MPHILVVDDDPSVRDVFEQYLRHSGYAVTTAVNGEDGLQRYASERFDALIVDYAMPGMSGLELIARVRETTPALPVILLSANRWETEAANASVHFLIKPANMETLVDFLSIILAAGPQ